MSPTITSGPELAKHGVCAGADAARSATQAAERESVRKCGDRWWNMGDLAGSSTLSASVPCGKAGRPSPRRDARQELPQLRHEVLRLPAVRVRHHGDDPA